MGSMGEDGDYIVGNDWIGGSRGEKKDYCRIEDGLTRKSILVWYDDYQYEIRGLTLTWSNNDIDDVGKSLRKGSTFWSLVPIAPDPGSHSSAPDWSGRFGRSGRSVGRSVG